jgi:EAL domain-containing protein (putative c-di-GMP-specific phosphodiesterase class I)
MALAANRLDALEAIDKIIDINLDILTTSYQQEGQSKLIQDVVFLRECIKASTVTPYAQPIFHTTTRTVAKYECLMRLVDPTNPASIHSIFPYLDTAKGAKLYRALMRQMLEKSFAFFANRTDVFSLNLSYEDIDDEAFVEEIFHHIFTCKAPSRIIFEIVETDFIKDFAIVERFAKRVRQHGCRLAIDDFGSGFSSMQNILSLKPEFIKIDGSLIKHLDTSKESQIIVKNIVNMAKELGAQTIAEYIHNISTMDTAHSLGVDFLQGFHLGKPTDLKTLL